MSLLLILTGCTDFVETELPPSQLTGQAVFGDRETAVAALSNIYAGLRDQTLITGNPNGISNLLGHYSDELEYNGSATGYVQDFSLHSILSSNSELAGLWNNSYNLVYACNSLLEGVGDNIEILRTDREQLEGEALFLRSFIHFYLNQLFGNIPYVTKTDYNENSTIGKMGNTEIQEFLISDLERAIRLLPEEYVAPDRVRINKYAALALLARVQLYAGNWKEAELAATSIMDKESLYVWEEELNQVFLKESRSILWQLKPFAEGGNALEGLTFIFETVPPPNTFLSYSFMQGFQVADQRAAHWTRGVTDGNSVWYHPFKYKENNNTGSSLEHSVVLRLGELYLIRAEARMQLGDLGGAIADLNKIRLRAGLTELGELDMSSLETAILQERRYELFTEFGHRWFDLKRFQRAGEVLDPIKPNWRESDVLFPIPQTELLANPNLNPQNNGY
jgi:hypothetical protein